MSRFLATTSESRAVIVARAVKLRGSIEQIFLDVASWNDNARKPDEAPIDPDPDGQLQRMATGLDRMLAKEFTEVDDETR